MNRLNIITVFATMALFAASCQNTSKQNSTQSAAGQAADTRPVVAITVANATDVEMTETFTSTIEPNITNNIVSQSAGRIKKICVETGDHVRKGQLLAEMDDVNLQKTRLQMINDSIELCRLKELYKIGGIAQADYDLAVLSYNLMKKTYANLLENTRLVSPLDGVVTARNYDENDMYSMAQPIFVVEQIAPVKMLINISESRFTKVHNGMSFDITVDAYPGEVFKGTVNLIHPTINPNTHTFTVEVLCKNTDMRLRPGMYAKVAASFGSNYSIVVPDVAVVKQTGSGDHFIYVLLEDGTVDYTKVTLGRRLGNKYEILSGLSIGDKIVTEGQIRLKDGISVNVKQETL